jgi:hypothetical protein
VFLRKFNMLASLSGLVFLVLPHFYTLASAANHFLTKKLNQSLASSNPFED